MKHPWSLKAWQTTRSFKLSISLSKRSDLNKNLRKWVDFIYAHVVGYGTLPVQHHIVQKVSGSDLCPAIKWPQVPGLGNWTWSVLFHLGGCHAKLKVELSNFPPEKHSFLFELHADMYWKFSADIRLKLKVHVSVLYMYMYVDNQIIKGLIVGGFFWVKFFVVSVHHPEVLHGFLASISSLHD